MIATAEEALIVMVRGQLAGQGYAVYTDIAPAEAEYPFIVISIVSGGEENFSRTPDARFTVQARCVADHATVAFHGARMIAHRLNDHGRSGRFALDVTHPDWIITTISQGLNVSMVEQFESARWIYHKGSQYEIVMEAKS